MTTIEETILEISDKVEGLVDDVELLLVEMNRGQGGAEATLAKRSLQIAQFWLGYARLEHTKESDVGIT